MKSLFLSLFLLLTLGLCAQTTDPNSLPLSATPLYELPQLDNDALRAKEMAQRKPGRANHFAATMNVDISPKTHGQIERLSDGSLRWSLRIRSAGALSLNLGFDKFTMPDGGMLRIYDQGLHKKLGPFTPADNDEHESLWTPVVLGDELVLEVTIPADQWEALGLHLKSVNHDFMGFGQQLLSGSCNVDVICGAADGYPLIDNYRDIIQSVGMYSLNGNLACTGFLVNSTEQNCTPLFMTAFHCGLDAGNDQTLVTYWNFNNSTCREPGSAASGGNGDGVLTDFNTGSVLLADGAATDFTLVQLDDDVTASANAYFAGWDASGIAADSTICVHHPNNDEKRITFGYTAPTLDPYTGNDNTHWHPVWDLGVTEPGSSGSPLFSNNHQIIGQLHGGPSSCTAADKSDFYGALHLSFVGDGTAAGSLSSWLDPTTLGVATLNGRSAQQCALYVGSPQATQTGCQNTSLTFPIELGGGFTEAESITITGSLGGNPINEIIANVAPGEIVNYVLTIPGNTSAGSYPLTISVDNAGTLITNELQVIVVSGAPVVSNLLLPVNANNLVSATGAMLTWEPVLGTSLYNIEVSTNSSFTNVIASGSSATASWLIVPSLSQNTIYYWRISGANPCGSGSWSASQYFYTAQETCGALTYSGASMVISPDGSNSASSTITINTTYPIADLNLTGMVGFHSYLSDLSFELTSPAGTTVVLIAGACGDLDSDISISFDDEATTSYPCPFSDGGTYKPDALLSAFDGENPNGDWTLTVSDNANNDGGEISAWGLNICSLSPANSVFGIPENNTIKCNTETSAVAEITAGAGSSVALTILNAPAGWTITAPTTLTAGQTSNILVQWPANTPPGNYVFNVEGISGTGENLNLPFSVTIVAGGATPALTSPANAATNVLLSTTLTWAPVLGASSYQVELSNDPTFASVVLSSTVFGTQTQSNVFSYETTFYWHIRAITPCGDGPWSTIYSYTTVGDYSAVFNNGANQAGCSNSTLSWQIQLGQSFDAATFAITQTGLPAAATLVYTPMPVVPGGVVSVAISNLGTVANGNTPFSFNLTDGTQSTTLQANVNITGIPNAPNITFPGLGADYSTGAGVAVAIPFNWSNINASTNYTFTLSLASDPANTLFTTNVNPSAYNFNEVLEAGTYVWTVVANNDCGSSTTSTGTFNIILTSTADLSGRTLTLAPNPATDWAQLTVSQSFAADNRVVVYDAVGRMVGEEVWTAGMTSLSIDTKAYPAGAYYIKVASGHASVALPLMVVR
jgi:subtilisin-like proprotein convertase family protein